MPLDFKALDKGLIVSCQPVKGGAMDRAEMVVGFALAALDGGAAALRIESAEYVAAVRAASDRPIIGLVKRDLDDSPVRITPFIEDVDALADAGADIIAYDATQRPRPLSTRMLVERSVYARVVDEARQIAENFAAEAARAPGKYFGPLTSAAQFRKVQEMIETGMAEGARLVAGGPGRLEAHECGYFVRPTVFAYVTNQMTIAREEIFGPVLSIIPFDTEEEAIAIANDTPYGLANYVQSTDDQRCRRVAGRLRSGMVEMNGRPRAPGSPFGGIKASGRAREGGIWGIEEFLEAKAVSGWTDPARSH